MPKLKIIVQGPIIFIPCETALFDGNFNVNMASFKFSKEWDGLTKIAFFSNGGSSFPFLIEDDAIKSEEGFALSAGVWNVAVRGYECEEEVDDLEQITLIAKSKVSTGSARLVVHNSGDSIQEDFQIYDPEFKDWLDRIILSSEILRTKNQELEERIIKLEQKISELETGGNL